MRSLTQISDRVATWSNEAETLDRFSVGGQQPKLVVWPETAESVGEVLRIAAGAGFAVVPVGGATALQIGNRPRSYDVALCLNGLNRVVEYEPADLTITVEAGMTIARISELIAGHHQRLALDPPSSNLATLGGTLAAASTGPGRLRFGSARDNVLGVRFALSDGTIAKSGGRVVKNVAGYDLTRLLVGSFGTLAVIVEASLKLFGLPEAQTIGTVRFAELHLALDWIRTAVRLGAEAALLVREVGWLGVVKFAGPGAMVERLVAEANVDPGLEDGANDFDRNIQMARDQPAVLRVTYPPARIAAAAEAMAAIPESVLILDASGVGHLGLQTLGPRLVDDLRRRVASIGGAVVVERQDPRDDWIDAWGPPPPTLDLMRALKTRFDPAGTLSPGRYVGGL